MYQVSIFNNGAEIPIHVPVPDKDAPHLLSLQFKESLSQPEQLSFIIPFNNPGYNIIEGLKTKVKVYDTRDNSVIFSGRVLPTKDGMTQDGKFHKEVTCEGALAFLNDTHTRRWNFTNQTPEQILTYLLNQHNSKVDSERQIQLGTVEITQPITIDTNCETTLNAIITKIRNVLGGDIRAQERNGTLYLDYLVAQGANNGVEIRLGYNLKEIIREYDPTDIVTRVIPLGYGEGINQLDITKVNGGVEYLEDSSAINQYGVIEGVVTNKDIQNDYTLKIWGQTILNEKKQPRLTYEQTALDLSVLTGHENEKYELGDTIHTIVDVLSIDVYSRVIERERDLINNPWNPRLTISTRPITLTDQIIDLKQRNLTLENAPQGSTYIDTYGYAENIDTEHPFQLPVWLSPDILNVNRVRLHIDSQKYRAYEKGAASGGGTTATSSNGGGTSTTTASGGGGSVTSSEESLNDSQSLNHPACPHGAFSHLPHWHVVSIPAHTHNVSIEDHTHKVTIPKHVHALEYGIFEDTYPKDVYVKVNGQTVAGPFAEDGNAFSVDVDLTPYISQPGQTYNIEVTSSRNGRVNVWVSIQAFIQAK